MKCYHSGPEWTWEQWQWRSTPHSPKLQHYYSFTIRWLSVITKHSLREGVLPLGREAVGVFYSLSRLGTVSPSVLMCLWAYMCACVRVSLGLDIWVNVSDICMCVVCVCMRYVQKEIKPFFQKYSYYLGMYISECVVNVCVYVYVCVYVHVWVTKNVCVELIVYTRDFWTDLFCRVRMR